MASERSRIEALRREIVEARIRREVREELDRKPAKTGFDRVWAAFNTPFVLFLLSSVVLAGVSQRFAAERNDAAERTTRRAAFFKLFTELEYRITRLERDESRLGELGEGDAAVMRAVGADAASVITGDAPHATSSPEYKDVYLGTIVNQIELTAGLPANRELTSAIEALVIDDCETATALHGELNVLRKWIELRYPLIDAGKLPKVPTEILSAADQKSLVMPDFDTLRAVDDDADARAARQRLTALSEACEAVS